MAHCSAIASAAQLDSRLLHHRSSQLNLLQARRRPAWTGRSPTPAPMPHFTQCSASGASNGIQTSPSPAVLQTLKAAQGVCFDVDSTFCEDESIDEFAAFLGVGDAVAAVTSQAMGGSMKFEDALTLRLGVMKPSSPDVDRYIATHPPKISKGIPELVSLLKQQGKEVFLVSGGFRCFIHPIAESLGIPLSNVFANNILFKEDGSYDGFDTTEFTSRSGGKPGALKHIKDTRGLTSLIMVGDGATDAEARQPGAADLFVAYGGVVFREKVAAAADWYISDIYQLVDAFKTS